MNWGERRIAAPRTTSRPGSSPPSRRWARGPRASACRCSSRWRTSRVAPGEDVSRACCASCASSSQFEIVGGLLIVLAVALPWYVAMYVRHGPPFTDRLIFHDMFNRAFSPRARHERGGRHELPLLRVAARLRALPVDGARAARASCGGCARSDATRTAKRGHVGPPLHVVPLRLRALLVHGHEVPPLHLPGGAAGGDAHRRRARRHARAGAAARGGGSMPLYVGGLVGGVGAHRPRRRAHAPRLVLRRRSPTGTLRRRRRLPIGRRAPRRWRRGRSTVRLRAAALRSGRAPADAEPATRRADETSRTSSRMLARRRRRPARCSSSLVGARPHHQARGRGPAGRDPPARSSSRTTTGARGPTSLDFSAVLTGFARGRRSLLVARARRAGGAPARGRRDVRVRVRLGRSGASTSTWRRRRRTGASTRSSRRTTPNRAVARRAARRLPDELEGRELLHGQPHPRLRLDRRDVHDLAEEAAREGGEGHVLRHRARAHRRPQERGRARRRTARSPTRRCATSSSWSAPSSSTRRSICARAGESPALVADADASAARRVALK